MRRKELLCCAQQTRTPHRAASLRGINYLRYEMKFTLVNFIKLALKCESYLWASFIHCAKQTFPLLTDRGFGHDQLIALLL
jgi:hypothetical protein